MWGTPVRSVFFCKEGGGGQMQESKYVGAILAAGRGTRMHPFSDRYPKPLLPVCNKPVISHQIEIMRSVGIREVVILVGHKGFELARLLGDGSHLGVRIRYVEQNQMLGIGHAVGLLEPHISQPFLLFLGDIYFVPANLELLFEIFEEQGRGGVLGTKEEPDPEAIKRNFAILLRENGSVSRVVEKPRHAPNRLKGVGIYLFDPVVFDAIRRTPRTALRDEYELTDAIQVMIDDGNPVRPANVVVQDINLSTPSDLLRANLFHASIDPRSAIGLDVSLHPAAEIKNSILGAHVRVENPILISHSLIFEETIVTSKSSVDRQILTAQGTHDCSLEIELPPDGAGSQRVIAAQCRDSNTASQSVI
jgi:dTDP-glucose pyrophosphorylase